jgi:hypothetical protein
MYLKPYSLYLSKEIRMQIVQKVSMERKELLTFLLTTSIFIGIFFITFKGFNGTDDMHYAMLASFVLKHRFEPFLATDLFTGRLGLIYWQSLLYRIGGINPFMTQFGTLFCTVICCYLTIFKLLRNRTLIKIVLASGIFYFTPVLIYSIDGILPDVYVMLGVILVLLLMKEATEASDPKPIRVGLVAGLIIFITCLFKEDGIILIVALAIISAIRRSKAQWLFFFSACAASFIFFTCYGFYLWKNSGDFFLRLTQISNEQHIQDHYPGTCHCLLSTHDLLIRLTYAPWKEAIAQGYFPVVISFIVILLERILRIQNPAIRFDKPIFLVLLFTILYFPSRSDHYQPVCPSMRQYLFLLPLATIILTETVLGSIENQKRRLILLAATALCVIVIMGISQNKWKWLTYSALVCIAALTAFAGNNRRNLFAALSFAVLAFLGLERLFFMNSAWYDDLQSVYRLHGKEFAYFPDHDNFMHWRLFSGFSDTAVLSIAPDQFPPDLRYGPFYKGFRQGRLIVNRTYSNRSPEFFKMIDMFWQEGVLRDKEMQGDILSYRIDSPAALDSVRNLLQLELANGPPI